VSIHAEHPFRDPAPDPARQLRGRLGGVVTLWTSGGTRPGGLTVSSVMVAVGEPPAVLALLDPDSDLYAALTDTGRAVLHVLRWSHRGLADVFAGLAPAPGGPFAQAAFEDTAWGPRIADVSTWAGLRLTDTRTVGFSALVTCVPEHLVIGEETEPLVHRRGRYRRVAQDS
jgi:flavin reductase (DIM6/NTAB) family NADH-FMN oxidoreductase RutF